MCPQACSWRTVASVDRLAKAEFGLLTRVSSFAFFRRPDPRELGAWEAQAPVAERGSRPEDRHQPRPGRRGRWAACGFFVTFQGISAFEQTQTLTLTETWRCGSCVRVLCCLQWADVGVAGRLLWPSHASILCCLQLVAAVSAMSALPALNLTHTSSAAAYLLLYVLNKLPYGAPLLTLPLHPPTVAVCSSLSPWHPFSRPPAAIRAEQAALWQAGGRQDWSEGGGHVPDLLLPHILFGCASLYFLWCTSVYLTEQQSRVEEGVVFLTHTHTSHCSARCTDRGHTRFKQLVDWCGKDFDGLIVFDESEWVGLWQHAHSAGPVHWISRRCWHPDQSLC